MSKPFNYFVRFLNEHQTQRNKSSELVWGFGCFGIFASLFLLPFVWPLGLSLIALFFFGPVINDRLHRKYQDKVILKPPPEIDEIWELIFWIGQRRQLNERTHPELRTLLEELAEDRRAVLDSFHSAPWRERAKTPEGQQTQRDIEAVLQEALYDALFIGRHLFRSKGQREATFRQRCQDPTFGAHALQGILQIRDEVRALRTSAIAASDQSDLRTQLVRQRLNTLVEAEQELESELGPLPND